MSMGPLFLLADLCNELKVRSWEELVLLLLEITFGLYGSGLTYFMASSSSLMVFSVLIYDLLFLFAALVISILYFSQRLLRMSPSCLISMYMTASLFFSTAVSFCLFAAFAFSSNDMNWYAW